MSCMNLAVYSSLSLCEFMPDVLAPLVVGRYSGDPISTI